MTWRRAKNIAAWGFEIPAMDGEPPSAVLRRTVADTFVILEPFAKATNVSFTTESAGDDAVVLEGDAARETVPTFDRHPDTYKLVMILELKCIDLDGSPLPIPHGAFLFIDRDQDDDIVSLYLSLKADIYAWRTNQDNSAFAERNAPLLARFLTDVRETSRCVRRDRQLRL